MTARNLKTRIKKLEASRKRIDEMLVVWRLPGADVSEAIANIDYLPGDRVICLEWFGEDPPPAPKWHEDLQRSLSREENDSIDITLKRILDAKLNREQPAAGVQLGPDLDELGYSDEDLLYILFGVPDGRIIGKL
jgi:hypothetical protein